MKDGFVIVASTLGLVFLIAFVCASIGCARRLNEHEYNRLDNMLQQQPSLAVMVSGFATKGYLTVGNFIDVIDRYQSLEKKRLEEEFRVRLSAVEHVGRIAEIKVCGYCGREVRFDKSKTCSGCGSSLEV